MDLAVIWLSYVSSCAATSAFEKLYSNLTDSYKKEVRAGDSMSDNVDTNVLLYVYSINELNGKDQYLAVSAQVGLVWTDSRLSWDPSYHNNITQFTVPADEVWIPPVGLRNSVDSMFRDEDHYSIFPVYVQSDGSCSWDVVSEYKASCDMDMRWFPFDRQMCSLKFGTLSQFVPNIVTLNRSDSQISFVYFESSEEVDVETTFIRTKNLTEFSGEIQMTEMQFWFLLHRRPTFIMLNVIIPVVLLAFMSALTFYVPSEEGGKIGMALGSMLTFAVFLLLLGDSTPAASHNIPLVTVYISVVICICSINVFIQSWTTAMFHKHPVVPLPPGLKKSLSVITLCLCSTTNHGKTAPAEDKTQKQDIKEGSVNIDVEEIPDENQPTPDEEALKEEWRQVSQWFDKFFFIFFLIIHAILALIVFLVMIVESEDLTNLQFNVKKDYSDYEFNPKHTLYEY